MSKNNTPDFFGMKKSPKYFSGKSNINLMGPNKSSKPKKNSKINPVSFMNNKPNSKKPYMNWNYKQIKKKFPGINPWGDADLDGSPNKYDCKPFNASKDGFLGRALSIATGGKKGQSKESFAAERSGKRIAASIAKRQRLEKVKGSIAKKFEAKGKVISERELQKKAQRAQKLKAFVSGSSSGRPIRKILIKKTKKGEVPRKLALATQAAAGLTQLAGIPAKFPKKKGKSRKGESVRARAGRPSGSFKFSIPGRGPVPIHVYKKWLAEQKAKARIKALAHVTAVQSGKAAPINGEEQFEEAPVEVTQPEEFQQAPQPVAIQQQFTPEQIRQIQAQRAQQPQQQSRQQGVAMGNLDFSTSSILTPQSNILNAPKINRGELTNVGEVPSVRLGERPQTNPMGDVFTDIDPVTGNTIVRRRISEKFATGEAR